MNNWLTAQPSAAPHTLLNHSLWHADHKTMRRFKDCSALCAANGCTMHAWWIESGQCQQSMLWTPAPVHLHCPWVVSVIHNWEAQIKLLTQFKQTVSLFLGPVLFVQVFLARKRHTMTASLYHLTQSMQSSLAATFSSPGSYTIPCWETHTQVRAHTHAHTHTHLPHQTHLVFFFTVCYDRHSL